MLYALSVGLVPHVALPLPAVNHGWLPMKPIIRHVRSVDVLMRLTDGAMITATAEADMVEEVAEQAMAEMATTTVAVVATMTVAVDAIMMVVVVATTAVVVVVDATLEVVG